MQWERPAYIEVNMSSEIGAYQDDFSRTDRGRLSSQPALQSRPMEERSDKIDGQVG